MNIDLPSPSDGRYNFDSDLELLTSGTGRERTVAYLVTPYHPGPPLGDEEFGYLTEREVTSAINTMRLSPDHEAEGLARFLDRVHKGMGLASLLREDGRWHQHRDAALWYAVAALSLAINLRDPRAEAPLRYVREVIVGRAH